MNNITVTNTWGCGRRVVGHTYVPKYMYMYKSLILSLLGKNTFTETGVLASLLVLITALVWPALDSCMAKTFSVFLCVATLIIFVAFRHFVMDEVVSVEVLAGIRIGIIIWS